MNRKTLIETVVEFVEMMGIPLSSTVDEGGVFYKNIDGSVSVQEIANGVDLVVDGHTLYIEGRHYGVKKNFTHITFHATKTPHVYTLINYFLQNKMFCFMQEGTSDGKGNDYYAEDFVVGGR